jgi:hypothetical protein
VNFGLVKLEPGADPNAVKAELKSRLHDSDLMTRPEFERAIVKNVLTKTPIGITFGTSTVFGLIVGFVIVSLSMFSAVVDNIREFGTLKAIGAKMTDLAILLFVQSLIYGVLRLDHRALRRLSHRGRGAFGEDRAEPPSAAHVGHDRGHGAHVRDGLEPRPPSAPQGGARHGVPMTYAISSAATCRRRTARGLRRTRP